MKITSEGNHIARNSSSSLARGLLLFLLFFCIVPLVSAAPPWIVPGTFVNASSATVTGLTLGAISGNNGDFALVAVGGSDTNNLNVDGISPGFSQLGGSGGTRRSEFWGYQSLDTETVIPVISDGEVWNIMHAYGMLVRGGIEGPLVQAIATGQTSVANRTANITTQRNNSVIVAFIMKSNNEQFNTTDGIMVANNTLSSTRVALVYKNATTAGTYTIGASWSTATLNSMIVIELASEENGTIGPSANFNASNTTSYNLRNFSNYLYNSSKVNILWMGDSISVPSGQSLSRWPGAFMRVFNHSTGWYSVSTGAGTQNGFIQKTSVGLFDENSSAIEKITADDFWNNGAYYGSLWHGRDYIYTLSSAFSQTQEVTRWHANATRFSGGRTQDWFTGNKLTASFGYIYDSNATVNYAYNFTIRNGTGVVGRYNVTDTSKITGGVLRERHLNLLSDSISVNESNKVFSIADIKTNGSLSYFDAAIVRYQNTNNTNGVAFDALAQSSTSLDDFYSEGRPTDTDKRFLGSDFQHYLSDMYASRTDADNFVVIAVAAEPAPIADQVTKVNTIITNITNSYVIAGLKPPRILLVSTWRTFDDNRSAAQSEIFWNVSQGKANVSFISMYGLTEGILLNNTGTKQTIWAHNNNYSAIPINNGTIYNFSTQVLIDESSGVHQNSEQAAFFFAYLVNNALEGARNNSAESQGPNPGNSTSTYVCTTGDRAGITLINIMGGLLILLPILVLFIRSGFDLGNLVSEFNIQNIVVISLTSIVGIVMFLSSAQNLGAVCG